MKDQRHLTQVAYDWLTKYHDFQWYYKYDEDRVASAELYSDKKNGQVVGMSIKVIDRRAEYYEKV